MSGFFGWFIIIVAVLAIFNAERLPALRQMMEEKLKGSLEAANKGAELAKNKLEQAKKDIEAKKNAGPAEVEPEENSPEEIEEALQFMTNYTKKEEAKPQETAAKETEVETQEPVVEEKKDEDAPIDLENRY